MKIIGIDLAGPANQKDTVLTLFRIENSSLILEEIVKEASDEMILETIKKTAALGQVVIGMDAPLSYQPGGGDRPQDKSLRNFMKQCGLSGSSVMPPTLTRMVYLTLRGISLSRSILLMAHTNQIKLVEVHPGAAIGLRIDQYMLSHALQYKKEETSRKIVLEWLRSARLERLPIGLAANSHGIDSCAAALSAWHWVDPSKDSAWSWNEKSTIHPYVFCC